MAPVSLAKMLGRRSPLRPALDHLIRLTNPAIGIEDGERTVLIGQSSGPESERIPITYEDQTIGWVSGGRGAAEIAALLAVSASQEAEKKSLASELIERYRELNLLYHLAETMAASPQPGAIPGVALEEMMRLFQTASGVILLDQEGQGNYSTAATCGLPYQLISNCCLIERVLQTGKAELANDIPGGDYFLETKGRPISLLCAPLKAEQRVLGAVILVGERERAFAAGELKLLNTIAQQVAPAIEIARLSLVAIEKARIEQELQTARQVQESLLPPEMPRLAGWSFAKRWRPAREVSGDFYDTIEGSNQKQGLVIADVTDKGMPAALFMVFARSALRASILHRETPAETIRRTNQLICQDSHEGLFATLFYACLSPHTGEVAYVNAGHNPPLFYSAQADEISLLKRTGLPLGVDDDSMYEQRSIQLAHGDFILAYTDGVTEAIDQQEREYGLERLQEVVYRYRHAPAEQILSAVEQALEQYTAPGRPHDDVTLMIVKRLSP